MGIKLKLHRTAVGGGSCRGGDHRRTDRRGRLRLRPPHGGLRRWRLGQHFVILPATPGAATPVPPVSYDPYGKRGAFCSGGYGGGFSQRQLPRRWRAAGTRAR